MRFDLRTLDQLSTRYRRKGADLVVEVYNKHEPEVVLRDFTFQNVQPGALPQEVPQIAQQMLLDVVDPKARY